MSEPLEIQIARLQEQLKVVISSLAEGRAFDKESTQQLSVIATSVDNLDRRLEIVEKQLAQNVPTIEEFITIKHQVKGAGIAGKWLWVAGGTLIGILYTSREAIRNFFIN